MVAFVYTSQTESHIHTKLNFNRLMKSTLGKPTRGFSCIILGVIYHPRKNNNFHLWEYLSTSLTAILRVNILIVVS
jgi:hypothetical protein